MNKTIGKLMFVLAVSLSMAGFFYACGNESSDEPVNENNADYLQLSKKADLSRIAAFSKSDIAVLEKAFYRLGLDNKTPEEAFASMSLKNANMSEDLYEFYYGLYFTKYRANRVRMKVAGEGRGDQSKVVQYVVHDILEGLGTNMSVDDISAWCSNSGYYVSGVGVPSCYLEDIFEHYFYYSFTDSSLSSGDYQSGGLKYMVSAKVSGASYGGKDIGEIAILKMVIGEGVNKVYVCEDPLTGREKYYYGYQELNIYSVAGSRY